MEVYLTSFFLIILAVLIILLTLFPGINLLTILNPNKKYFHKASLDNNQLQLKGFRNEISVSVNQIRKLSMGTFTLRSLLAEKGMFAVQIDTETDSYYLFQSPFNLFAPALKRDIIKQMKTANPTIELDYNLIKYTEESLADMYINKDQIKRGIFGLLFLGALVLLAYLERYIKQLLGY